MMVHNKNGKVTVSTVTRGRFLIGLLNNVHTDYCAPTHGSPHSQPQRVGRTALIMHNHSTSQSSSRRIFGSNFDMFLIFICTLICIIFSLYESTCSQGPVAAPTPTGSSALRGNVGEMRRVSWVGVSHQSSTRFVLS